MWIIWAGRHMGKTRYLRNAFNEIWDAASKLTRWNGLDHGKWKPSPFFPHFGDLLRDIFAGVEDYSKVEMSAVHQKSWKRTALKIKRDEPRSCEPKMCNNFQLKEVFCYLAFGGAFWGESDINDVNDINDINDQLSPLPNYTQIEFVVRLSFEATGAGRTFTSETSQWKTLVGSLVILVRKGAVRGMNCPAIFFRKKDCKKLQECTRGREREREEKKILAKWSLIYIYIYFFFLCQYVYI